MGTLMSTLDSEQSNACKRSLRELLHIIESKDTKLAELIEHIANSSHPVASQCNLQEFTQYVKSNAPCSGRSSRTPTDNETPQAPQPSGQKSYFLSFERSFEKRRFEIQSFLNDRIPKWRLDPLDFWGQVSSLTGLESQEAFLGLAACIDKFEGDKIASPIRRRLSLVMLHECRIAIEHRIQALVQNQRLRVKPGMTYKAISSNILCSLYCKSSSEECETTRRIIISRLRAGERYSQLRIGTLLTLGNTPHDGMEKCSQIEFALIQKFCANIPNEWDNAPEVSDQMAKLDELAIHLKEALWNEKLDETELDAFILTLASEPPRSNANSRSKRKTSEDNRLSIKRLCQGTQSEDMDTSSRDYPAALPGINGGISSNLIDNPATPPSLRQGLASNFLNDNDPDALLGINGGLDSALRGNPAALSSLSQGSGFDFNCDNPAELLDISRGLAPNFMDNPAALSNLSQERTFDFVTDNDPAALLGIHWGLTSDFWNDNNDPAALLGINRGFVFNPNSEALQGMGPGVAGNGRSSALSGDICIISGFAGSVPSLGWDAGTERAHRYFESPRNAIADFGRASEIAVA